MVRKKHGDKFGPDMNWFFDQTLYGTGICDYKVAVFNSYKQNTSKIDSLTADTLSAVKPAVLTRCINAQIGLQRLGEVMLPVDVLVHFSRRKRNSFNLGRKGPV